MIPYRKTPRTAARWNSLLSLVYWMLFWDLLSHVCVYAVCSVNLNSTKYNKIQIQNWYFPETFTVAQDVTLRSAAASMNVSASEWLMRIVVSRCRQLFINNTTDDWGAPSPVNFTTNCCRHSHFNREHMITCAVIQRRMCRSKAVAHSEMKLKQNTETDWNSFRLVSASLACF